jgi:RHS repeat-associated protein
VTTTYGYNSRDQLLSETNPSGATTYTYDPAGRMISKTDAGGTTTYTWVDEDRMASVTGPGVSVQYQYDADGRRVKETVGSVVKQYLIDRMLPYGQVVLETDGGNQLVAEFTYGLERISQARGGSSHFYLADGQGSIRQLTDSTGTVSDTWDYTAFGELLARTGTTENRFTYTGEESDPNSGFTYLRARWMDPSTGRFVGVDPYAGDLQAPVSLHRYLYANSSPTHFTDPTGEYSLTGLMVSIGISSSLNIGIGLWQGQNTARAIAQNAIVGALEGAGGYFAVGAAIKIFTKFARYIKPEFAKAMIERISKSGNGIPGTGLSTQITIQTEVGEVLLSSGLKNGAATGALKHVVNDMLQKSGGAVNTELAELLALKELEGAIVQAVKTGVIQPGQKIFTSTAYAKWELIFEKLPDGTLKIYHALPYIF